MGKINLRPDTIDALLRLLAEQERRIRALETAPRLPYASVDIGAVRVSNGTATITVGQLDNGTVGVDGRRVDGTPLFTLTDEQTALHDGSGNTVFAIDPDGGGLVHPHLPVAFASLTDPDDTTSSTDWTPLQTAPLYGKQHAQLRLALLTVTTGAGAEYRITADGAAVHGPVTVTQGRAITTTPAFAIPGDHAATVRLDVEARTTSGSVGVRVLAGEALPA